MVRARRSLLAGAVACALGALLAACGADTTDADRAHRLEEYVAAVQPIRLGINGLLDRADPVLSAYADGRIRSAEAKRRMGEIEARVARYAVQIAEVHPVPDELRAAQDAYAHTFVLQDTYLSTLVAAIPGRRFDELPHFQDEQRAAIIAWRTRLQVLADRWGVTLPANLQVAGRGEISPSPSGD